jgi:hypothetical protein
MAQREGWKNVLVVEDDMVWNTPFDDTRFQELLREPHDVIMLGANETLIPELESHRVVRAWATHAYFVESH